MQKMMLDCFDCIDGTHFPIKPPKEDRNAYLNRKGWPSVNVLLACMRAQRVFAVRGVIRVVDHACIISRSALDGLQVVTTYPGACGDARVHVSRKSAMQQLLRTHRAGLLLADSGYIARVYPDAGMKTELCCAWTQY
jgi:hypothetical protein